MRTPSCPRVAGPLAPYAQGFWEELGQQGYSGVTAQTHIYLMAHLSRWLVEHDLDPGELSAARLDVFAAERRARGRKPGLSRRGLAPLVGYLRGLGVVPEPARQVAVASPCAALLEEFTEYLVGERGLAPATVRRYRYFGGLLLSTRAWDDGRESVGSLSPGEIAVFMLGQRECRGAGSLNNVAAALRGLARFLYVRGLHADVAGRGGAYRTVVARHRSAARGRAGRSGPAVGVL